MFRSMKVQDDEAHLEYEFARYLVRMAAMRCESKRIWCRDYINGKGTLHLRNWLWIKYYNQIVEDRLLVFVFLLKQLLRLESKVLFYYIDVVFWRSFWIIHYAFDYSFMQLSCSD
ncbi:BnaC08g09820D [Brassica napus]|uniref:BnaC08g09820D protein n=2 Tax=Brassica TaxID=3705 RepID=A0A078HEQ3_BRANA|nr:BnaC08g09820D [Brassica napus]VDD55006.1 unnamed protein product [Brassica oleracea]